MNGYIRVVVCVSAALLLWAASACSRDDKDTGGAGEPLVAEPKLLEFPPELRAEDPAVNGFITEVIETCAAGDYEAFRMLWSAHDDPFPRDQFYQAWRLVRRVRILALRAFRDADGGRLMYAARARVELEPTVEEPQRTVTILITKEDGRWRLTRPPASLPEGLLEPDASPSAAGATTTQPG
jgi:hypothetical protein